MNLYIGCYTNKLSEEVIGKGRGIVHCQYDEENASVELLSTSLQRNPSYLTKHPSKSVLYAVEEYHPDGLSCVYAYQIAPDGSLIMLNFQLLDGYYGCHLVVMADHLIVAKYGSGDVSVYPLDNQGLILPASDSVMHSGSSINKSRQESPHPHMIFPFDDELIYVPDLGIDVCKAYYLKDGKLIPKENLDLKLPAGYGPRHMAQHPEKKILYVLCELTGALVVFDISGQKVQKIGESSILPEDFEGQPSAAAIRMHPSGRYLYTSERSRSIITRFCLDENSMLSDPHHHHLVHDRTPRDFCISMDGEWIIVGGQDSDTLSIYQIAVSGEMNYICTQSSVMTPVAILDF